MAKTMIREKTATSQDAKKQRKKQAKQEAKLMLKVEDAKKAVQKAEAKMAKAQAQLHDCNAELHKLEDQLAQLRSGQHGSQPEAAQSPQAQDNQSSQDGRYGTAEHASETLSVPTNQIDAQPPAEGRSDLSQDDSSSAISDNDVSSSYAADSTADKGVNTTMQNDVNPQETPTNQVDTQQPAEGRPDISEDASGSASTSTPTNQVDTQQPAEGRPDISEDDSSGTSTPTNQVDTQQPAEGRPDISDTSTSAMSDNNVSSSFAAHSTADRGVNATMQNDANPQEAPNQDLKQAEESLHIDSGGGSMPIVTDNPQAWPPPEVREEIAQGAVDEVKHPQSSQAGQSAGTSEATSGESGQAEKDQTQLQQRYGYGDKG